MQHWMGTGCRRDSVCVCVMLCEGQKDDARMRAMFRLLAGFLLALFLYFDVKSSYFDVPLAPSSYSNDGYGFLLEPGKSSTEICTAMHSTHERYRYDCASVQVEIKDDDYFILHRGFGYAPTTFHRIKHNVWQADAESPWTAAPGEWKASESPANK